MSAATRAGGEARAALRLGNIDSAKRQRAVNES
jgi:hypothetical protein